MFRLEFMEVGKQLSALEVLSDVLRSKKHRQWSETHESIMRLYLKLCTDLQKSMQAKDGLYQYRNICKDANLNSFKIVIDYFLNLAEKKAKAAREESAQTVLDIEDLDAIQTPESILLSTVSGEDRQDRTDRIMLMPWVKFLWESFRNILELLKNNYHLEKIYTEVAKRAFEFCLEYKRRTEFHKLCDILRNHLMQLETAMEKAQSSQQHTMRLDHPETIQYLVDTRFEQLDKSIAIDLWQEAFKAIESIHILINRLKQKAKPSLLENFYQKQASVYWMANNKLFHAAALHRLFVLRKEQKKSFTLDSDEAQQTASQVLLATLSVPILPVPSEMERFLIDDSNYQEKSRRLSALLRIQTPPTRVSLLGDLVGLGITTCVSPELMQLYDCLQTEFNPLTLCKKVQPLIESLSSNASLSIYIEPLKEITLVRFVKQVKLVSIYWYSTGFRFP
jgi:translation initiation factor 3 subunit A